MDRHDTLLLKAVGDVVNNRLAQYGPGSQTIPAVTIPAPTVRNEVHVPPAEVTVQLPPFEPVINCDMTPVANVLAEFARAMTDLTANVATLIKALSERPAINVNVPETTVNVAPAQVTVEAPQVSMTSPAANADRPKRVVRIRHDDGTESVAVEE